MRRREFMALFAAAAVWPLGRTLSSLPNSGSSGISTMEVVYRLAAALHLSTTSIDADPSWRDCGNVAGSRDKMLPLSDGLRRARQIGSLHLPLNSLPSTSTCYWRRPPRQLRLRRTRPAGSP